MGLLDTGLTQLNFIDNSAAKTLDYKNGHVQTPKEFATGSAAERYFTDGVATACS